MHQAGGLGSKHERWSLASYTLLHVVFLGKVAESIECQVTAANAILIITAFNSINFCLYQYHTVIVCSEGVFYCFEKAAADAQY